jgi:hypothetical protein
MEILGARDFILSLHRHPENNFTDEQTRASFATALKAIASEAAGHGITLHLRLEWNKPPRGLAEGLEWLDRVGATNVKLAANLPQLAVNPPTREMAERLKDKLGLWLVGGMQKDVAGKVWDTHAPIHGSSNPDSLARAVALAPNTPLLLDALYSGPDEEYLEAVALKTGSEEVRSAR